MRFSIITTIVSLSGVISVQCLPSTLEAPFSDSQGPKRAASFILCLGSYPSGGCTKFPVAEDKCINFTGGRGAYYKAVSAVRVDARYVCTLYRNFSCVDGPSDLGILTGGLYNLTTRNIPNGYGHPIDFDDEAASIACRNLTK